MPPFVADAGHAAAVLLHRSAESDALEESISSRLLAGYRASFGRPAATLIEAAIAAMPEQPGDVAVERVTRDLEAVALAAQARPEDLEAVADASETSYRLSRGTEARRLGATVAWRLTDTQAVNWSREETPFWVRKFYSTGLSEQIRDTIRAVGLEGGQGIGATASALRAVLTGVESQTDAYWRLLATNGITRSRNFGNVGTYEQVNVTEIEVLAVMDARTSAICRMMNGRRYRLETLVRQRDSVIGATPDQLRTIAAWPSAPALADALAGQEGLSATDAAARLGVAVPPYHGNCRTDLVARRG